MLDAAFVEATTRAWLRAWNAHDLEAVLALYADPLEFVSPLVVERLGRPDGTIRSKADLREYFDRSLGPDSNLHFEHRGLFIGVASWTTLFANHRGQLVAEVAFPDAQGLIGRTYVHHLTSSHA
jgi:hypothetical protein